MGSFPPMIESYSEHNTQKRHIIRDLGGNQRIQKKKKMDMKDELFTGFCAMFMMVRLEVSRTRVGFPILDSMYFPMTEVEVLAV